MTLPSKLAGQNRLIAADTAVLLAGQVLGQIIAFPIGVIIARTTGPAVLGQYATAVALVASSAGLFLLGLDAMLVRETARQPDAAGRFLATALTFAAAWSVVVIALTYGVAYLLGYSPEVRLLVWLVAAESALLSLVNLVRACFRGLILMRWDAVLQVAQSASALMAVIFAALTFRGSIVHVASAVLVSRCILLVLAKGSLARTRVRDLTLDPHLAKGLLWAAIPFGVAGFISAMYYRLDAVLLGLWRPEADVGLYFVAYNLTFSWLPVSISLARSLAPRLSYTFASGALVEFRALFQRGMGYALVMGLPLAVLISLLSGHWIELLYGPAFGDAQFVLAMMGPVVAMLFLSTYMLNVLVSIGKQNVFVKVSLVCFAAMVGASVLLVPRLGLVGIALAVLVRECVALVLFTRYLVKSLGWGIFRNVTLLSPVAATSILGLYLFLLAREPLNVLPLATSGGVIFLIALFIAGGVRLRDCGLDTLKACHSVFRRSK